MAKLPGRHYRIAASDWAAATITGSMTTNTTYTGKSRRVGDMLEVEGFVSFAGAPNATQLYINIPGGLTIDTAKISGPSSVSNNVVGAVRIFASTISSDGHLSGVAFQDNSTRVSFVVPVDLGGASGPNGGSYISGTFPTTIGSTTKIAFKFAVPIVGWSVNDIVKN